MVAHWKMKDAIMPAVSFAVGVYSVIVMDQCEVEGAWPPMT
jgi:hypothetical protein